MPKAGPTGRYTHGKLTPDDGGELQVTIGIHDDGKIILDFGVKTSWIGFDPEHADDLAAKLMQAAQMIREHKK